MQTSGFLDLEEKLLYLGTICKKKQTIALGISYHSIYLRSDLRSDFLTYLCTRAYFKGLSLRQRSGRTLIAIRLRNHL